MILITYLIKTILISGVLFGYYYLFLKNRQFHGYNRFFLLAATVTGFILPLLQFRIPGFLQSRSGGNPIHLLGVGRGALEETVSGYTRTGFSHYIHWEYFFLVSVVLVTVALMIKFVRSLIYIQRLRRDNPVEYLSEARLYHTDEKGTPFSFFRNIFWDKKIDFNSKAGSQILLHEIFHVKSKHSLDIVFLELACILNWFNPFLYLIRGELKAIHEYGADAYASESFDAYDYAKLLLLKTSGSSIGFSHPFFNHQIKRRITMITKNKSIRSSLSARFLAIPFAALLICLFGFQTGNFPKLALHKETHIRVVVDAGHGGAFDGTTFHNVQEKNINLSIAKKIQELAKNYNIDIILSRDKDETPGSTDLRQSLEYIASLPGKNQASLFISIHTNRLSDEGDKFQNNQSGFEIYVPRQTNNVYNNSVKLASSITESIKPDYTIAPELKQRDKGVYILDKATVPAVLIECGYMDNASDLNYLQDEKNQEKIAADILAGIKKYSDQTAFLPVIKSLPPDSTVVDRVLTYEELKKIDPNTIQSLDVDKENKKIFVEFKNGKNATVFLKDVRQNRSKSDTLILNN